jgi:hypothetical protein
MRGQKYTGAMAAATHPNVDFEKAMASAVNAYYDLLETLPYLMGGASKEELKDMEREQAVEDYKKTIALDERGNQNVPPVYNHKKVGG